MARSIWEALENNGKKVVSDWAIPRDLQAKLDNRLDTLRRAEVDESGKVNFPPGALAGPNIYKQKWIYKLRINGQQALRPMLCLGPCDREKEWSVLARAKERDGDTAEQQAAAVTATTRRQEILDKQRGREMYLQAE